MLEPLRAFAALGFALALGFAFLAPGDVGLSAAFLATVFLPRSERSSGFFLPVFFVPPLLAVREAAGLDFLDADGVDRPAFGRAAFWLRVLLATMLYLTSLGLL